MHKRDRPFLIGLALVAGWAYMRAADDQTGFIAIGKKDKAHKEKKRSFELKEMARSEKKAAAEAELEALELLLRRKELEKKASELGVTLPGGVVAAKAESTPAAASEGMYSIGNIWEHA